MESPWILQGKSIKTTWKFLLNCMESMETASNYMETAWNSSLSKVYENFEDFHVKSIKTVLNSMESLLKVEFLWKQSFCKRGVL